MELELEPPRMELEEEGAAIESKKHTLELAMMKKAA